MVELLDCTPAEGPPMTNDRLPLAELMAKADDGDFLRSVAESVLQILMEADVEGVIGAARYERSGERATYRNGYRERGLDTRLGTLNLKIPKLRTGSYFPGFLDHRHERLLDGAPRLEEAGEVGSGAQLGDLVVQGAHAGIERPIAVAVAVGGPLAAALVAGGSDQALDIGFHQDLEHAFGDTAQKVAVIGLRHQLGQW